MHFRLSIALLAGLVVAARAPGYSVLTHEAIIDATWKDNIQPLLLKRYPDASPEELRKARAFTYGGAIIQDMGYYPFGAKFVSDLTHYVRSGDFILNLLAEAHDLNEYAFALGALAHYASDNNGHRMATNRVVPILFPHLRQRFGDTVTYADNIASHLRVEFSFDVSQVAAGNYARNSYHDFIGFEVSQALLERAFAKTYSLKLGDLMNEDMAIGTYRYAVRSIIPLMTSAAWQLKKDEILKVQPSATKRKFIYNLSRSDYHKQWGKAYRQPGPGARAIAFLIRVLPKVGPLRSLAFKAPTPATEKLFMQSVNETLDSYRKLLAAQRDDRLRLPNENFDTGKPVAPGNYRLADAAYAKLLDKLSGKPVPADLRADILAFYADLNAPIATKHDKKAWAKTLTEIEQLRGAAGDGGQ
jgi:Zinc dependent phospholipase C